MNDINMTAVIITAIICATIVILAWTTDNDKKK